MRVDEIPAQHLINVLEVFGWALVDTVRELDHVKRREDITAENFMAVMDRNVQGLHDDATKLGVDVKFVREIVSILRQSVSDPPSHPPKGRASLRLVYSRSEDDHR